MKRSRKGTWYLKTTEECPVCCKTHTDTELITDKPRPEKYEDRHKHKIMTNCQCIY